MKTRFKLIKTKAISEAHILHIIPKELRMREIILNHIRG
jgi:hypothetical protein